MIFILFRQFDFKKKSLLLLSGFTSFNKIPDFVHQHFGRTTTLKMSFESWLDISEGSPFSLANIPFGIITPTGSTEPHAGIAIGDHVLDLHQFAVHDGFSGLEDFSPSQAELFSQPTLNDFASAGQKFHNRIRLIPPRSSDGSSSDEDQLLHGVFRRQESRIQLWLHFPRPAESSSAKLSSSSCWI